MDAAIRQCEIFSERVHPGADTSIARYKLLQLYENDWLRLCIWQTTATPAVFLEETQWRAGEELTLL